MGEATGKSPIIYLAVGATDVEVELIDDWMREPGLAAGSLGPGTIVRCPAPTAPEPEWPELVARLGRSPDDVVLAPVRVSWLPPERAGRNTSRLVDLARGHPRRPSARRQAVLRRSPERFAVVAGESATLSALRSRWDVVGPREDMGASGFARFVVRRAVLAVERAEYRLLGAEYKMPRLVREQITISARFHNLVTGLAEALGRPRESVAAEADKYLAEMVAGSSKTHIDFTVQFAHTVYRQGYDPAIDVDRDQIEVVRSFMRRYPAIVLPSHRSNLDALVMPATLHEHHLPRTHTFGGINMSMWPIGPLFRKGGTIFIRRDASDNVVYKAMLREYVGYLMEKRFSLQWYIEGTRSRTGKVLPPKLGLLTYVVDAYKEGRTDDVALLPASIAYDQFHDVNEYAQEAGGRPKDAENLAWAVRWVKSQRQQFGKIYVRFAEPLLLSEVLGTTEQARAMSKAESRLAMQKVGLEVARRINTVTPVTGTAMVTLALLSTDGRARTAPEIHAEVRRPLEFVHRRSVPTTASARELDSVSGVQRSLEALERHGVVHSVQGPETLFQIGPDEHVRASYYRNTVVHFFLLPAIIELALVSTAIQRPDDDLERAFFDTALSIRDLLKFDFFFEERDAYVTSLCAELDLESPGWRQLIATRDGVEQLIDSLPMLWSPVVLHPLLEAYWVVADALQRQAIVGAVDERAFSASLPDLGRYALARGWIRSPEAVSAHLFKPALELMRHRGLLEAGRLDVLERRVAMANEVRALLERIDAVAAVGIGRANTTDLRDVVGTGATRGSRLSGLRGMGGAA